MAKNIVILSDGTGQSYTTTKSNVLRLYEFLLKDSGKQVAIYNPGIATSPLPIGINPVKGMRYLLELGLGVGLIEDVTILYKFLMSEYEPKDRIFLFGFSRGAFTVRALAALIHVCGLLKAKDIHLLPDLIELFLGSESRIKKAKGQTRDFVEPIDHAKYDVESAAFKSKASQTCEIDFMGLWDTVKAYGFFWPRSFPCLRHNPSVKCVRHAMALNEQRSLFQITSWGDRDDNTGRVKEVWFRGDHSNVGGGHDKGNDRLTDITLDWMLGEATNHDLLLDASKREEVRELKSPKNEMLRNLDHGLQWWLSRCPRPELDNTNYPPARPLRLRPSGTRHPVIDSEHRYVRYHITVPEPDRHPAVKISEETTLDIKWHNSDTQKNLAPVHPE